MYSAIDHHTDELALQFCTEAERLWAIEQRKGNDTILNIAAIEFISLGYLGQGRDHSVLKYLSQAAQMGVRMRLFGIEPEDTTSTLTDGTTLTDDAKSAHMYTAWGVFNWLT